MGLLKGYLSAFLVLFVRLTTTYREEPAVVVLPLQSERFGFNQSAAILNILTITENHAMGSTSFSKRLFARQQSGCDPGWTLCSDGLHCAPPGTFCCPDNMSTTCPTGGTCCPGSGCAEEGYTCCEGKDFTCLDGYGCCPVGRNCAPPDGVCCGEFSCEEGEKCCPRQDALGIPCTPKDAVCCGEGWCDAGATCCSGGGCAKPGTVCCGNQSCSEDLKCCEDDDGTYCADECLPTIIFPHLEGFSEEIMENMCEGIRKSGRGSSDTDVLTWDGGRGPAGRKANARRRKDAGCGGRLSFNCDEIPENKGIDTKWLTASTIEGGTNANIKCVPIDANNWQGTYWSSWLAEARASGQLVTGGKFRVKLKFFNCGSTSAKSDLDKRASPILSSNGNVTVFSSSAFGNLSDGENAVIVPLTPDPDSGYIGEYTVSYSLKGGALHSAYIMDDSGEPFQTLAPLQEGSSNTTTFRIDDEGSGNVWLLGWTKGQNIQVEYSVKAPKATPPSATPSNGAEKPRKGWRLPYAAASLMVLRELCF